MEWHPAVPLPEYFGMGGKVGTTVFILGASLTIATSVTFNGVAATGFKAVSSSEIKATVPGGASTGTVEVVTSLGTLKSNLTFHVMP